MLTTPHGDMTLPGGPERVRGALDELKRLMWTPEKGAWIGVELVLDRDSRQLEPGFNYTIEPADETLPAETLAEELRHFPRPPERLPDWWPAGSATGVDADSHEQRRPSGNRTTAALCCRPDSRLSASGRT